MEQAQYIGQVLLNAQELETIDGDVRGEKEIFRL